MTRTAARRLSGDRDAVVHKAAFFAPQRGQALIIVLVLLAVGATALIFTLATPATTTIENDKKTAAALAQGRDALIGYAAADNRPGSLPCPDINNNGSAESPIPTDCPGYVAGSSVYVGRLPWRTLRLPDLRDGSGERLWYAVSREFARNSSSCGSCPLNSDTSGLLTVSGSASGIIAIVFSAGAVVNAQVRDTVNENTAANYLEGGNENGATTSIFFASSTSSFNDKLLTITSDDLFSVVTMRVAREVRAALNQYYARTGVFPSANQYSDNTYKCHPTTYDGRIPLNITVGCAVPPANFADWALGDLPPWFVSNNWNLVVHYAVSSWCASTNASDISQCSSAGGLTVTGVTTKGRALIIATGRRLGAQVRPCSSASNCLEDVENANGDTLFVPPVRSALNNDRLLLVAEAP